MPEYQGEKFKEYLEKQGISAEKAAEVLGKRSRQSIYKYFDTKNLSREVVDNIVDKFGISEFTIWPKSLKLEAKPLRLADPYGFEATNERIYKLPDESLIMQVPVIPFKAWGSYMRGHQDPEFYEGLDTMPVPVNAAHKGAYLIFETGGESMLNPGSRKCIWPGEKLIGRDLRKEHWKYKLHINSNECWIIVHKDGIVVKEITHHNIDTGIITLHSWNPDKETYPDYDVSLEDVEQIFNVVDPFNKFG
ncbi:MAG: XRE family transcriptional regulator [Pedobacter sp.]|nr:MAG: XRE family transcriptional regulator [Pedobacter sp.]